MKSVCYRTGILLAFATLLAGQSTFTNSAAITGTSAPANSTTPYPSNITVSGLSGTISAVQVRLKGFTHGVPADLDILLVGPAGQKFVIMSDAGRAVAVSNITFTLSDSGATTLPNLAQGTPGPIQNNTTYRPTAADNTSDNFPSPAPAGPYSVPAPESTATFGSVFNGANPNGTWALYVTDDVPGDNWTIANGWDLIITTAVATPTATLLTSSMNPSFTTAPGNSVTFTATVTSGGNPVTTGTVTFLVNGSPIASNLAVNASGVASTTTTSLNTEGSKTVTATYNGNASFAPSSGTLAQMVDNHTVVTGNTFCNTGTVTISGAGAGAPYPQRIFVSGLGGTISKVTMQLPSVTMSALNGLDLLLVSPNGAKFTPVSDVGTGAAVSGLSLTLDDSAASGLPQSALTSGTYQPRNYSPAAEVDSFPEPAPGVPYLLPAPSGSATFATAFAGGAPNGAWQLFAAGDTGGDTGSLGGYCLTVTTSSDAGTTTTVTSSLNPSLRNDPVTFTATVRRSDNNALVTTGTVAFSEGSTVLAGPVALNGSGTASFTNSTLNEGAHNITATYSGVAGSFNTSFGTVTQQVDNPTVVSGLQFCNNGPTTIPNNGLAQPYGQRILVSGLAGLVNTLTVNLNGLTHPTPDDWDVLLVSPSGQKYVLMADVGGVTAISGVNLTLSDSAASALPNGGPLVSGTYRPAVYETATFASPAPAAPYVIPPATLAATFGGFDANRYWSLYVVDDVGGNASSLGGYCLNFTLTTPELSVTKTHSGNFRQGQSGASYTVRVTNNGPGATQGTVTVDDTLPAGLTATNFQGTGWTCGLSPLRCTRADSLAAGASYPDLTLTVNVAGNAASSVTNSVTASGGGDTTAASASDVTSIVQAPDMTVTKSHSGNFTQGQQGTYTIVVRNSGAGPTDGTVTLADNLPAGLTIASMSGTGWSCNTSTASCTRSDVLAAATNYPDITAVVNVSGTAPSSVTNQAVVTGGGELNTANNVANDVTTINPGTFNVSVSANIPGLSFTVDGTAYTSLQSFAWVPGSTHDIATTTPQGAGGTRYVWQNWSDGGAIAHSVAPSVATSYVANFSTQYLLTAVASPAAGGSVAPAGFFNAGDNVTLTATPAACYTFGSWSANAPGGIVNMSGPQTVTATFLSFISSNVTAGIQITRGSFRLDRATNRFVQQIDLVNNSGSALTGVAFVVDSASAGVSLANGSGVTACAAPAGSAYLNVGAMAAGGTASFLVQFNNPSRGMITYTPRILAGPGQP